MIKRNCAFIRSETCVRKLHLHYWYPFTFLVIYPQNLISSPDIYYIRTQAKVNQVNINNALIISYYNIVIISTYNI